MHYFFSKFLSTKNFASQFEFLDQITAVLASLDMMRFLDWNIYIHNNSNLISKQ